MRDIDHMNEDIGIAHLVEGAFEGIYEVGGELANKPYGVGEQEREVVDNHLAHSGVESGKKFVFGKHIALAEQIHKGGFTHIGVADKGNTGEFSAILALDGLLAVESAETLLKERDFVENDTTVGLNLSLTGTAHTDTTALALEVGPHASESRQEILILCEFDLHLGIGGLCTLGKDVQNQIGSVKHLHF